MIAAPCVCVWGGGGGGGLTRFDIDSVYGQIIVGIGPSKPKLWITELEQITTNHLHGY